MKNLITLLIISSLSITSCTKGLDLDLNSSDPQIIVEANFGTINNAVIKLTESVNFDDANIYPTVEGAIVTISDELGNSEQLTETSAGVYKTITLTAISGRTYSLQIEAKGKSLSSECSIPEQVAFDSLIIYQNNSTGGGGPGGGGGTTHNVFVRFQDPISTNYYRFAEYKNGEYINSYVFDDKIANGEAISNPLLSFNRKLATGDTLVVEMQCIDKAIYEYYRSFGNLGGGPGGSSTPANPYTNVEGTELGYFSTHTQQTKTIIIQ